MLIIHQYWDGDMPPGINECMQSIRDKNKWCEYKLWDKASLPEMEMQPLIDRCASSREASDVIRAELLYKYGGIWLDSDMECLKSLEPLHVLTNGRWSVQDEEAWVINNKMTIICGAFGCSPGDPYARALMDKMREIYDTENPHIEYSYESPFDWLAIKPPKEWRRWILPKDICHWNREYGYCLHWCNSCRDKNWDIREGNHGKSDT